MKVTDPGHNYTLADGQELKFLKKVLSDNPGLPRGTLVTVQNGTTNEEVVAVLLDRLRTLNAANPCRENSLAITKFEEGLHWLNARTSARLKQNVEGTDARHS